MDTTTAPTVVAAFDALRADSPARPILTYYDDASGERTELSIATLANWVAKTANLLVDGCGLGLGDIAAIRLPPHWQTAAIMLGCWTATLTVDISGTSSSDGQPAAVAFVAANTPTADTAGNTASATTGVPAGESYALSLAPMAAPFRDGPPAGTADYVVEVRGHGDHFSPTCRVTSDMTAIAASPTAPVSRHGELVAAARAKALPSGARLLIDISKYPDPLDWLVAPLLADCSIVLCANLDPDRLPARLSVERARPYPG